MNLSTKGRRNHGPLLQALKPPMAPRRTPDPFSGDWLVPRHSHRPTPTGRDQHKRLCLVSVPWRSETKENPQRWSSTSMFSHRPSPPMPSASEDQQIRALPRPNRPESVPVRVGNPLASSNLVNLCIPDFTCTLFQRVATAALACFANTSRQIAQTSST